MLRLLFVRIQHQELASQIDRFFDLSDSSVYRSPVWKVLKQRLLRRRNWKNAPRGKHCR